MSDHKAAQKQGISIIGQVIAPPETRSGTNKAGSPYNLYTYMVMCGQSGIVRVTEMLDQPKPTHQVGDVISVIIQPSYKDNGVIVLNGLTEAAS